MGFCLFCSNYSAGLAIAVFGSRISCRRLTIFGGTILFISMSCAYFAKTIWHMFLVMFFSGKFKNIHLK